MGKTDIRDPDAVAEGHPEVAYQAFDLIEAGPERIQEMLTEMLELFDRGALEPLPVTAWDIRRAPEAFRFMSQARHTGKIVLSLPAAIDSEGTALVTGGTGVLGGLLARHLVSEHGVRHLLLASRRGEGPRVLLSCEPSWSRWVPASRSPRVTCLIVSSWSSSLGLVSQEEHPLRVIVHAAGVLDDGVIGSLTAERVDRVLAAKVDAAWHLHQLTQHLDLQAFICFSSAAGVLGSPGQGNYAAANAFWTRLLLTGVRGAW